MRYVHRCLAHSNVDAFLAADEGGVGIEASLEKCFRVYLQLVRSDNETHCIRAPAPELQNVLRRIAALAKKRNVVWLHDHLETDTSTGHLLCEYTVVMGLIDDVFLELSYGEEVQVLSVDLSPDDSISNVDA